MEIGVSEIVQHVFCYNIPMKTKTLESPVIRNRVYEHYRGNRYLVVDIAKDADQDADAFRVVYRALYDHGQLYVTSHERFTGMNNEGVPRFRLIEEEEQNRNPNHHYPTITM